jgi:hypothetical protein
MVRMGPPGAFSLQSSIIGFPQQVFYRRRTANPRGFLTELRQSGPLLRACSERLGGPSRRALAGLLSGDRGGGKGRPGPTRAYGFFGWQSRHGGSAEVQRSGGEARHLRADVAALHAGRPYPLPPPARRALPHTRGRDRGVLVRARPAPLPLPPQACESGPRAGPPPADSTT